MNLIISAMALLCIFALPVSAWILYGQAAVPQYVSASAMPMKPVEIRDVLEERNKVHGDWERQAATTHIIKEHFHDSAGWRRLNPQQKEALDMIATKVGRILSGDPNFKDHWDDIAGYATLVADKLRAPVSA